MLPDRLNLAAAVRECRIERGLSLREAAAQIGISTTGLFQVEHGNDPRWSVVQRLLKWMEMEVL